MIFPNAVIYSASMWDESKCLLVAKYAAFNVIKRLSETESMAGNPVLGRYLSKIQEDANDTGLLPITLLVGGQMTIGERLREFIIENAVVVIDCQTAFSKLEDPEESAPPICPAVSGSGEMSADRVCPEEYEGLQTQDRDEYDPSNIRCHFEEIEEAACPSRPDFETVREKRKDMIDAAVFRNRAILAGHHLRTRDALVLEQHDIDTDHSQLIYSKMIECIVDEGKQLPYKEIARRLSDAGLRSKRGGEKLITSDDLRHLPGNLGKTDEWASLKANVRSIADLRKRPFHRLSDIEKLMLIMSQPLANRPDRSTEFECSADNSKSDGEQHS